MSLMFFEVLAVAGIAGAVFQWDRSRKAARRAAASLSALERERDDLNHRLAQRSLLSNEIAHDIKNPITAILCSAEALELILGPKLDDNQRRTLAYIREYGEQLLRLVSDFLDLSLLESGARESRPERVDLVKTAETIAGLLQSQAFKKHQTVTVISDEPQMVAWFDPKHLKQVLFNLVHNAIKFTPDRGEVKIMIRRQGSSYRVQVCDTGMGIPEGVVEKIFNPYERVGGNHPVGDAGIGLGLAVCRELMELGKGAITCSSIIQVGSVFEISLPVAGEKLERVSPHVQAVHPGERPLEGQRVLVVDEDEGARESVAALAEALGAIVDRASFAIDALDALSKHHFDAVMIDHETDGGAGYALARIIRVDLQDKSAKIVLAGTTPPDSKLAREFGADSCVIKPLSRGGVLEALSPDGRREEIEFLAEGK